MYTTTEFLFTHAKSYTSRRLFVNVIHAYQFVHFQPAELCKFKKPLFSTFPAFLSGKGIDWLLQTLKFFLFYNNNFCLVYELYNPTAQNINTFNTTINNLENLIVNEKKLLK